MTSLVSRRRRGRLLRAFSVRRTPQILGEAAPAPWMTIAENLRMPFDEQQQVFLQYDGYDGSLIKQADTVLLIYPVEWPMSANVA